MSTEKFLDLQGVCRAMPSVEGKAPHLSAVWRWCRKGVRGLNGERIKLRHVRVGRRVLVPADAVPEFLDRLAAADAEHFDAAPDREAALEFTRRHADGEAMNQTPRRRREIERAKAAAKKLGV